MYISIEFKTILTPFKSKHNNHPIFDSGIIHNHDLKSILENNSLEIVLDDISNECGSVNRFALSSQDEDLDTNINYFLRTLFKYCQEHDSFEITLVIDEIQKINIDANHPLNDIISEGRKFDISLIVATQQLNDLKPKVISKLRDVGTKLIFQTDDTKLSSILDSSKSNTIRELLKGLTVGQCILYGSIEDINHNMTASNSFIKITIPYNID